MREWRPVALCAVVAGLLAVGCSLERPMTEKDFVRISLDLYYEGRQAEEAGDLAKARDLYTRSLRLAPRPIAYYQLGMVEFKEQHNDAAIQQMNKALALSPNFTQASEAIKRIQGGEEMTSQVESRPVLAEEARPGEVPPVRVVSPPITAQAPAHAATPEGEIVVAPQAETPPPALVEAPKLEESAPVSASPAGENLRAGLLLLEQRKYAEAEAWFKERLPRDPGNADLYFYLGNALFRQGRYNDAYQQYLRALQVDPEMARAYVNLGFCQEILGSSLQAEKSYLRAIELGNHPDALYNLGLLYQKRGMFKESIHYLEAYLAQAPNAPSAQDAQKQLRLMRREH